VAIDRDLSVLVVEDDVDELELVNLMLQGPGRRVLGASNASEALKAAQSARIDVLVTDVMLPGLSGPGIAHQLRSLHRGLPVVFMSGWYDPLEFPELEGEVLLHKPFSLEQLRDAIDIVLRRRLGDS
jgi:two-component system cell cycle sensor histidine kinase/response regulator CckA